MKQKTSEKRWRRSRFFMFFSASRASKIFTGYEAHTQRVEKSLINNVLSENLPDAKRRMKAKNSFARKVENSRIVNAYSMLADKMLSVRLRVYGIFLFAFAFYSALAACLKYFAFENTDNFYSSMLFSIITCVVSIFIILNRSKTCDAIDRSLLGAFIAYKMMGSSYGELKREECFDYGNTMAFFFGMICGIVSFWISPVVIILGLCTIVFVMMIIYKPEFGVTLAVLSFPFIEIPLLSRFIFFVFICYIFKVLRGKRILKIEASSLSVLCFGIFVLFAGLVSVDSTGAVSEMNIIISFIMMYLLIINLFRSTKLVSTLICVFAATGVLSAVIAVIEFCANIEGNFLSRFINPTGTNIIEFFSSSDSISQLLIMTFPLITIMLIKDKKIVNRSLFLIVALITLGGIFVTVSDASFISLLISIVVLCLFLKPKSIFVILPIFVLYFSAVVFLPPELSEYLPTLNTAALSSQVEQNNTFEATVLLIKQVGIFGIGLGKDAFKEAFSQYSIYRPDCSATLYFQMWISLGIFGGASFIYMLFKHVQKGITYIATAVSSRSRGLAIALLCGLVSIAVFGFFENIWSGEKSFFMLFVMCALLACQVNSAVSEEEKMIY